MSKNLEVALSLVLRGQQAASAGLKRTKDGLGEIAGAARGANTEFKRLHDSVNGFSTVSKGLAVLGGWNLAKQAEDTVLAYQRIQLELRQTAGLTNDQVEQISDYAKNSAAAMLSTPTAMLEGAMKLANAGMKWADLLPVLKQASADAAAFRATVADMANMDFDISTKMKIDAGDLSAAHNMLLYHARSGRFEAPAMSRGAPELFTYASRVGLTGTQGLNLVGAMTQQVMKGIAPDQQTKVLTDFEQGFSHIVTPHYMKGLSKIGLDVEKYMPHGQFYGDGGVQGFLDLVRAMKAKGLTDPIKLAKAGFADKETKDFWLQMMNGVDEFEASMRNAAAAAKSNQTTKDREEISASAVGQDQQAKAKWEARQLDAEGSVSLWESAKNRFMENPLTSAASLAVLAGGARSVWKKRQAGKAAAADTAESARQSAIALRPQNVFVTNWPASMLAPGELLKQKRDGRAIPDLPGGTDKPVSTPESKSAKFGRYAMYGAAALSEVAAVGYASYQATSAAMETQTGQRFSGWLADQAAKIMAAIGDKQAQEMVVNLHLDGQQITQVVNSTNTRTSRRN